MKKLFLYSLFLIVFLGCSRIIDFAIINNTDEAITVSYYLKQHDMRPSPGEPCCPKGYNLRPPRIVPIEKLGHSLPEDFPECDFVFDKKTGKVTATIPPNELIWVQSMSGGYSGGDHENYYSRFDIRKIIIKTSRGIKEYDEVEAMKIFKQYHFFDSELFAIEVE